MDKIDDARSQRVLEATRRHHPREVKHHVTTVLPYVDTVHPPHVAHYRISSLGFDPNPFILNWTILCIYHRIISRYISDSCKHDLDPNPFCTHDMHAFGAVFEAETATAMWTDVDGSGSSISVSQTAN